VLVFIPVLIIRYYVPVIHLHVCELIVIFFVCHYVYNIRSENQCSRDLVNRDLAFFFRLVLKSGIVSPPGTQRTLSDIASYTPRPRLLVTDNFPLRIDWIVDKIYLQCVTGHNVGLHAGRLSSGVLHHPKSINVLLDGTFSFKMRFYP
ncbi:hypothetical protein M758_UG178700, partial [Ceratodon purpureus]